MRKIAFIAGCLAATSAHAQSTGIPWVNGRVLTASMLQTLDQAKMNINSLGKPGFAPQLNALGQITNPVVGDVSQAKATSDGQTVVQVTAKAANSVQKDSANQPNGYVQPDSSGTVTLPLSGDASSAPTISSGSTTARFLRDRFADTKNVKDFGIALNGSDSTAAIKSVIDSIPNSYLINIPAGKWNGVAPDNTDTTHTFFLNGPVSGFPDYILNNNANQEHVNITDYGDGNTGIALNSKGGVEINRIDKTRNGYWPMATLRYVNANPLAGSGTTSTGLNVVGMSDPVGTGITVAMQTSMVSDGRQGGGAYDIAHQISGGWFGTNWMWNTVSQLSESAGIDVGTVNGSLTNTEVNLTGTGPEVAGSDAWPGAGRRSIYYINSWLSGLVTWNANSPVIKGKMVHVTDAAGGNSLFVATTAGTTGAAAPVWATTGTITDGTAVWQYLSPYTYQISKVLFLNRGNSPDNQYIHYGAMVASDADFYDAAIDFSKATYSGANPSALRTKAGVGIDFSADGTLAGQNNHTLSYSGSGLTYSVKGSAVLSVDDNGLPKYTVANIAATGSTVNDAATMTAAINYIDAGSSTTGVKPSAALAAPGVTMLVKNGTGNAVNVYPIDGGWSIANHAAGVPVVLPSHASLTLYRANLGANTVEADYHPVAP